MARRTTNLSLHFLPSQSLWAAVLGATVAGLSACGGGGDATVDASPPTESAAALTVNNASVDYAVAGLPALPDDWVATPSFHAAPVLLAPPDDADVVDSSASARRTIRKQSIRVELADVDSREMTVEKIQQVTRERPQGTGSTASPLANTTAVVTYTPAQIRAAYGLPALPAVGTALTAEQAAQLGAGQTIYIVNANHNPNVVAELAAFNQKFGLPGCTVQTIATSAVLPLAAAPTTGCTLSVVYSTTTGAMTSTAPAFDAGWATEIALDVQWAHATAPMARLVLIEAPDASVNSLSAAVQLANKMGPGVVSMSFGANEGSWTSSFESTFSGANMTYVAATGDSGAAVSWPAVSPKVVAVSGTSLTYSGVGARSETAWSNTGGGTSQFTAAPSYQTGLVPGLVLARRTVADVSFNADPNTGQFVAVIPPGASTPNWISAGGTSLSTPQWAGLMAVANAQRFRASKTLLGQPHTALYGQVGGVPGNYALAMKDITTGSNGSCVGCTAVLGYDLVTGWGTPNVGGLLSALTGLAAPVAPPTVGSGAVAGKVGTALAFKVTVTSLNPVTYSLSGAPSGLTINTAGDVAWPTPVAGTYAVTVTAKDSKTGLTGQGVYTLTIAPKVVAPVVTGTTVNGTAGTALSFQVTVSAPNPVAYTLTSAPAGMTVTSTGLVSWAAPVAGTYSVTVTAKDSKTGLSGQGVYKLVIATKPVTSLNPVVQATSLTGKVGQPLSGRITFTSPAGLGLNISITGVPQGMGFTPSAMTGGMALNVAWSSPVQGNYTLAVTATDSAGRSTKLSVPVTVAAR